MAGYNVATSDAEKTKTISVNVASEEPASDCAKKGNGYVRITNLNKDNVANIETEVSITMKNSRKYLFTVESEVAITGGLQGETRYIYTNSNDEIGTDPNLYVEGSFEGASTTIEKAKGPGTYYLHILLTDSNGIRKEYISEHAVTIASTADFFYSGTEQTATLAPGTYKLETWGAQGGNHLYGTGGYGGYSTGTISLSDSQKIYVVVGEQGKTNNGSVGGAGGYNGGGTGGNAYSSSLQAGAGGGGATHISTTSGMLSTLSTSIDDILMVSGAGGGSTGGGNASDRYISGNGGGFHGNNSEKISSLGQISIGATQTSGYNFGIGQNGLTKNVYGDFGAEGNGGAGAGYYGGYTSQTSGAQSNSAGSGGSGYIGNPLLKDKYMVGYNVETSDDENTKTLTTTNVSDTPTSDYAKSGNGHARITNLNTEYSNDGLILHYDAINNTGSKHDSSSTTWKDLSGHGFDGTLHGNTWGDNYLSFDGIDDWVSIAQMNYSNPTIEVVVEYSVISGNAQDVIANWENGGYGFETYSNNRFIIYNVSRGYISAQSSNSATINKKYSLSGRYDNTKIILRENGDTFYTQSTENIGFPYNNTIMMLGSNPGGTSPTDAWFSGKIYSVRVYNRTLSDEEVYNNYIYDKLKFNIE